MMRGVTGTMPEHIAVALPAEPDSIPKARGALDRLTGALPPRMLDDLRLLVSEVFTNSVRHAGATARDEIELSIAVNAQRIRVEVNDPGPGFEPPTTSRTIYDESGWGLFLVDRLADRWGVISGEGTTVWFELDR